MNRENPSENDLRLLAFLEQILEISPDPENAGRIQLLGPTGEFIGDATLSARDFDIVTDALARLNAAKDATTQSAPPAHVPTVSIDKGLEAELEEYCIGLDTDFLMDLAGQDPNSAVAAFDEITAQWDGEV